MIGREKLSSIKERLRQAAAGQREELEKTFAERIRELEQRQPPDQREIDHVRRMREMLLGRSEVDGKKGRKQTQKKEPTELEQLDALIAHLQKEVAKMKKKRSSKPTARKQTSAR